MVKDDDDDDALSFFLSALGSESESAHHRPSALSHFPFLLFLSRDSYLPCYGECSDFSFITRQQAYQKRKKRWLGGARGQREEEIGKRKKRCLSIPSVSFFFCLPRSGHRADVPIPLERESVHCDISRRPQRRSWTRKGRRQCISAWMFLRRPRGAIDFFFFSLFVSLSTSRPTKKKKNNPSHPPPQPP